MHIHIRETSEVLFLKLLLNAKQGRLWSSSEWDGVLDKSMLNPSQHCALAAERANHMWGESGPALPPSKGRDCPLCSELWGFISSTGCRLGVTKQGHKTIRKHLTESYKEDKGIWRARHLRSSWGLSVCTAQRRDWGEYSAAYSSFGGISVLATALSKYRNVPTWVECLFPLSSF